MAVKRPAAVTFRGNPLTLVGPALKKGDKAPDFTCHRFTPDKLLFAARLADTPNKPRLFSVVPSLDTPVCSTQTKKFNQELAALGDQVAAYTISADTPFAQNRFCGSENITNMTTLSDYQERSFGQAWGMLIDELKLLARGVFVVDSPGLIQHAPLVPEVATEPDYEPALKGLRLIAE